MGMLEKRAIKAAQEGWLPRRQSELNEICGTEVPYDIEWESFANDEKGIKWIEHNGPHQVSAAFRGICTDDVGREAVQEGLTKIVLSNVEEIADKSLTCADGVLHLCCAFAKSPRGRFTYQEIQKCLEEVL